jgi:hypothetical protein
MHSEYIRLIQDIVNIVKEEMATMHAGIMLAEDRAVIHELP